MNPILAVDWGTKRIGLAMGDPSGQIARPLDTLTVTSARHALEEVKKTAENEGAGSVLLGLPLNMDGSEGTSAARARRLGEGLVAAGWRVMYCDERLTSEDAMAFLKERGERRPPKARIDQVAALLLLQGFLDAGGPPHA